MQKKKFLLVFVSYHFLLNSESVRAVLHYVQNKYGIHKPQQKADSGGYKSLTATTPQECGVYCTMDPTCVGYSFRVRNIDTNISQPCELNNNRDTTFVPDEEYDYYASCITDQKFCKANGNCEAIVNGAGIVTGYYCFCEKFAPRSACQFGCVVEEVQDKDVRSNDVTDSGGYNSATKQVCGAECAKTHAKCQSVAFSPSLSQCFFKSESQYTKPEDFVDKGGVTLYQIKCTGP